jgi:hypothetical protein
VTPRRFILKRLDRLIVVCECTNACFLCYALRSMQVDFPVVELCARRCSENRCHANPALLVRPFSKSMFGIDDRSSQSTGKGHISFMAASAKEFDVSLFISSRL